MILVGKPLYNYDLYFMNVTIKIVLNLVSSNFHHFKIYYTMNDVIPM